MEPKWSYKGAARQNLEPQTRGMGSPIKLGIVITLISTWCKTWAGDEMQWSGNEVWWSGNEVQWSGNEVHWSGNETAAHLFLPSASPSRHDSQATGKNKFQSSSQLDQECTLYNRCLETWVFLQVT